MPDYNKLLSCGDYQQGLLTGVIDIPHGSSHKIEWDRTTGLFHLDRVDPGIFAKPVNYGFIPQTLDEDGDELDILCITREPLVTGLVVHARILGLLNFRDGEDMDYKILTVPVDDRDSGGAIRSIDDVPSRLKQQIEHHFNHYKDFQTDTQTQVLGWGGLEDAIAIVAACSDRWAASQAV
ncbi:inorganic diphosphatase [Arthrobacter psychrochitiniphilus]|uniref:Inorganic pyrophosphatase n=1 Tax=Arthrobacter psychrochitiniphilus TaxID=291045 RepID=A0A2V3DWM4_9MICC|nr:inorganic diphosphatase [Arthrobacter psychrochitiniphilus]NYG16307.1 inorganic pyrophosphatase [Arthrobacter psychrochitiniphilus]PXA69523.1 inorganic pyrophosphatase [Arthrobacter psychrochitiniphilus]